MTEVFDLIIIGAGPAGLTAAIYAQRAKLRTLVIEKEFISGGQMLNTWEVDNYPGLPGISGMDLGERFRQHADALGAAFVKDTVQEICEVPIAEPELLRAAELSMGGNRPMIKEIHGRKKTYQARTVIIASGAAHKKLGVPGEEKFAGAGVSYCATCDGAFYRGKVTAVVGGGDVAVEDAIYLSRMCERVYLIHRRDELRAAALLQEKVLSQDNITVIWDTIVEEILGIDAAEELSLKNKKTGETKKLSVDGVFIAVGIEPNSGAFEGFLEMDHGYICAGETGETSVPGVFAAGDIRTKPMRQIITAAADGANAVAGAERYLMES
ncbi:MAG: thioredoxin-disulfide reductase [Clostridiales bacterium]|nr:thioredoxin-disulfide reductase [Clostridiales bacterium]